MKKNAFKTLWIPALIVISVIVVKYYQRHKPKPYDIDNKAPIEQTSPIKKKVKNEDLSREEILKSLGIEDDKSAAQSASSKSTTTEGNNNSCQKSDSQEEFHALSFDEIMNPDKYPINTPYYPIVNPSAPNSSSSQSGIYTISDEDEYISDYESQERVVRFQFETLTVPETWELRGGHWLGAWKSDNPSETYYRSDLIKSKNKLRSIRTNARNQGVRIEKSPYEDCEGYYSSSTHSLLD